MLKDILYLEEETLDLLMGVSQFHLVRRFL
jgi:hypothetical protein